MANLTSQISCEFFPPKQEEGLPTLVETAKKLTALNPEFFSVTYGAGGGTRELTVKTVLAFLKETTVTIAPHITCLGSKKETIAELLHEYKDKDIKNLVALRGDIPKEDYIPGDFNYANELVEFIRQETGDYFHVDVAAYPEFHPESTSPKDDLINLKRKIDAGANRVITQYFFSFESFQYFLDDCNKMGITIPIVPGIMPIVNWEQLKHFSDLCGTDLPSWLHKRMHSMADDKQAVKDYGCEFVTHLCEKLLKLGAPGLHFYTMNKSALTLKICENLGLIA